MSLVEAFYDWCVANAATLGQDQAFISRAPSSNVADDAIWWFRAAGGAQTSRTIDGKATLAKVIEVYYRHSDSVAVATKMEQLEDEISCSGCLELTDYIVVGVETTGPYTDNDLDNEERTVGLLQVTITIFKEGN